MTIRQALGRARDILVNADIEDPPLESELLLRHVLEIDRVRLYLELDRELNTDLYEKFWCLIQRRLNHEPTAYITGHREFYGLDFHVDSSVLIPRPESELLVEKAIELARNRPLFTIAEIGTGCGAIAVSLALNLPQARIYASDISALALEVALSNCRRHGVENRVCLLEGDMLDPLPGQVDIIVANLPYVRESELALVNTLSFEPFEALSGGLDGLDKIRRLCTRLADTRRPGGWLLLEIGQGQGEAVTAFLISLFPSAKMELIPDLSGIERVVSLKPPLDC
ncbi:peptide chain release factor N(5)-glutamine methyltransferase [Chloroflexota bacterium]